MHGIRGDASAGARVAKVSVAALVLGLSAIGCVGDDSGDQPPNAEESVASGAGSPSAEPSPVGEELPVEVTEADSELITYESLQERLPAPPDDASLTEDVLHTLRTDTVLMAGVWAETSGECEGGELGGGDTATCVVRYAGEEVRWSVTVDDGPGIFSYTYTPDNAVLTAQAVRGQFWTGFNGWRTQQRCSDIPDVTVVPVADFGRQHYTGFRCQYLDEYAEGNPVWRDHSVVVDENGEIGFIEVV
ncbi:hypothetical protein [Streptomyces litchfieldiae]|uniref:Lipoprotein n=1 Tax=Streptomyces litchfieldiae TaxID=3075543 RepID=A0ABU2N0Y2_9ACTN|nr:hypothetical protein [Streptomyces sp. DSM 44938]MDT0347567.1 hypothetical protein [Streptomyces sp. DSM 44938]